RPSTRRTHSTFISLTRRCCSALGVPTEPSDWLPKYASISEALQLQTCEQTSADKPPCCVQPLLHTERNSARHSAAEAVVAILIAAVVRTTRNARIPSPFYFCRSAAPIRRAAWLRRMSDLSQIGRTRVGEPPQARVIAART